MTQVKILEEKEEATRGELLIVSCIQYTLKQKVINNYRFPIADHRHFVTARFASVRLRPRISITPLGYHLARFA